MSLLNDALRKNRSERFSARDTPNPEWSKSGFMSGRKRRCIIVSSGIAILVVASAVWLYLYASPPAYGRAGTGPAGYPVATHAGAGKDPQAAGIAITVSRAVSPSPVVPPLDIAAAPVPPAVHAPGAGRAAEAVESSPAFQPSVNHRDSTVTEDGGLRKHADTGPVLESPSPQERRNSEPQAVDAGIAREEPPRQGDRLYQRACQFHRRNSLEQAISLYQTVLKADPEHAQARLNLVAAYLQTGAYTRAYPMAAKLFSEDPTNQQVILNLAIAHMGCGRDREALALLDKAAKLPDAPRFEIEFHKAVAFSHLGRPRSALACYRRAEILRPEDPGLLFNLAVSYDQQQQFEAAVIYYRKYLKLVRQEDTEQINQIRRRIRTLQAYGVKDKLREKIQG